MVSEEGKDSRGGSHTPLQLAVWYEHLEIVKYLVKRFPTVDLIGQRDDRGRNSLHYAAIRSTKDTQMLQFLINNYNGKDIKDIINQVTNGGNTPLDAVYLDDNTPLKYEIAALLIEHGAKANIYDENGNKIKKRYLYDNITIKF